MVPENGRRYGILSYRMPDNSVYLQYELKHWQPIFTIWFNSEAILLLLRQEKDVAYLAALYLKWVSLGLPAYTFNGISRYVQDASYTVALLIRL
jgi:hypothetical protein